MGMTKPKDIDLKELEDKTFVFGINQILFQDAN